jgi:hypothetical protein
LEVNSKARIQYNLKVQSCGYELNDSRVHSE